MSIKLPSIRTVASRAGVSTATVSNVLNARRSVAPELVARVEQADQHHGIEAQAGQDAQVEVKRIERGAHDLGVGHDDGEALLALGAEELQVEIHVSLLAHTFEKALDDFWFHQEMARKEATMTPAWRCRQSRMWLRLAAVVLWPSVT